MKRLLLVWTLFPFLPLIRSGAAQEPPPDSDRAIIRQLLERVQQLETEVRELKARQTSRGLQEPEAAPKPAAVPPQASMAPAPMPGASPVMDMPDASAPGAPRMQFRGFSDVSYHASDLKGDKSAFALGQFNLFITSKISERMSVLAEAVVEADDRNAFGYELERLQLQYSASDYLNASFGRYHTAIGWYNTAYHHSTWMQTAVGRPFLFEFEDKGGILPVHNVGVSVNGRVPSGSLGLRYIAEIGNGRASRSPLAEPVQNVHDENNGKAFNLALLARPDSMPGFQAGFSYYRDNLTPYGMPKIGQTLMAVHAIYQGPVWEWLNEAVLVRNDTHSEVGTTNTPAFYSQVSRKFGLFRPYFRYQYMNVPDRDPINSDVRLRYGPSIGMRLDLGDFAAFKIQYDRTDGRNGSGFNSIITQLSFAF